MTLANSGSPSLPLVSKQNNRAVSFIIYIKYRFKRLELHAAEKVLNSDYSGLWRRGARD